MTENTNTNELEMVIFTGTETPTTGQVIFKIDTGKKDNGKKVFTYAFDPDGTYPCGEFKASDTAFMGDNRYVIKAGMSKTQLADLRRHTLARLLSGTPGGEFRNGKVNKVADAIRKLKKTIKSYKLGTDYTEDTAMDIINFLMAELAELQEELLKVEEKETAKVFRMAS